MSHVVHIEIVKRKKTKQKHLTQLITKKKKNSKCLNIHLLKYRTTLQVVDVKLFFFFFF